MIYKIVYFLRDIEIGSGLYDGADPEGFAAVGMIRHRATQAKIFDSGGNEVQTVHAKKP